MYCSSAHVSAQGKPNADWLVQYGKQYVPVSADDEAYLAYKPERGIHLLGFLPADSVPMYQYLKACSSPHLLHDVSKSYLQTL